MSDSSIDPEPLDAEFEPADSAEELPPDTQAASRLGASLITFALASLSGGALGFAAVQFFPGQGEGTDPGASERAAISQSMTGLETRLAAMEAEDPAAEARTAARATVASLDDRISELEARPQATGDGNSADLSDIEARLAALEARPVPTGEGEVAAFDPSGLIARLDDLETGQAQLDQTTQRVMDQANLATQAAIDPSLLDNLANRIAALEAASDARDATNHDAQIEALNNRVGALESELAEARSAVAAAQTTADGALAAAEREPEVDTEAERILAARAIALTALRDAAATGGPFEAERAAIARLWRGNADLAALANYSRAGAPTLDELRSAYPGQDIRTAAGSGQRLWGLLQIQRVDADSADRDPLAVTALAEAALNDRALADAVTLTEQLEGDALDSARDWLLGARARLETDARLEAVRQTLAETAAELGTDPS